MWLANTDPPLSPPEPSATLLAMGVETAPSQKKYIAAQDYSQENHVEGLPLGTRGGMLIKHLFQADGDYVISWFPVRGNTGELFGSGRTVLFGLPGAFTPGCSRSHLPGYLERADDLKAKGVDRIACVAVNDAFVMGAWADAHDVGDKIVMVADGNGEFTKAMGLELDGTGFGMGTRSKRYAAVIDDGTITHLDVDESGAVDQSSCAAVIDRL